MDLLNILLRGQVPARLLYPRVLPTVFPISRSEHYCQSIELNSTSQDTKLE